MKLLSGSGDSKVAFLALEERTDDEALQTFYVDLLIQA
jgi:hypothetical protein